MLVCSEDAVRFLRGSRSRTQVLLAMGMSLVGSVISSVCAYSDEVRVVDGRGLVRAIKVARAAIRVVVILEPTAAGTHAKGECVARNIDGLAAEKRVQVTPKFECVFADVSGGSWQVTVPQGYSWRVQLYE